jgi:hypothetical protein
LSDWKFAILFGLKGGNISINQGKAYQSKTKQCDEKSSKKNIKKLWVYLFSFFVHSKQSCFSLKHIQ